MNVNRRLFNWKLTDNGCVDRIQPKIHSVKSRNRPVGAIADENATADEIITKWFLPQASGDCIITDHLKVHSCSLRNNQAARDWKAAQAWRWERDHWAWSLKIDHLRGKERELSVELQLPHPLFPGSVGSGHSPWRLWMPLDGAPFDDYGVKTLHCCKCIDEGTDTPLPLATLFHGNNDVSIGFSYLMPPDQMWYVDLECNQRQWLTRVRFQNIALPVRKSVALKFWCFNHEGDWRSALGWVRRKFPLLFAPVAGQRKLDGNMAYTVPMIPKKRIRDWSEKMKLKWNEMLHFRHFGDYCPEEPFQATHFQTPAHPEWGVENLTYADVNRYIDLCHQHGVMVNPYFNLTECEAEFARKNFAGSIARMTSGDELVTWNYFDQKHCTLLMNCDPQYPWFQYVIRQFEKLLKKLPGIDGFFFDQMSYGWIDVAHSDGETFYNNRPAYNLGNMYIRALRQVRKMFPRPRINGIGNGVVRWQMMKFLDGAMAEGSAVFLNRLFPLCLERPMMLLAEGEHAFQNALYYGSWLHVSPYYRYPTRDPLPADAVRLFAAYNPLFEFFVGRKWVYAANPLQVLVRESNEYQSPLLAAGEKIRSNIFETPWGGYVIVILNVARGLMREGGRIDLLLRIKIPKAKQYKEAVIFGADYRGYRVEKIKSDADGRIEINLSGHGAATMVALAKSVAHLRSLGDWSKLREPLLR